MNSESYAFSIILNTSLFPMLLQLHYADFLSGWEWTENKGKGGTWAELNLQACLKDDAYTVIKGAEISVVGYIGCPWAETYYSFTVYVSPAFSTRISHYQSEQYPNYAFYIMCSVLTVLLVAVSMPIMNVRYPSSKEMVRFR